MYFVLDSNYERTKDIPLKCWRFQGVARWVPIPPLPPQLKPPFTPSQGRGTYAQSKWTILRLWNSITFLIGAFSSVLFLCVSIFLFKVLYSLVRFSAFFLYNKIPSISTTCVQNIIFFRLFPSIHFACHIYKPMSTLLTTIG